MNIALELFEGKQNLVFAAIKQQFGSLETAARIAERNNMELADLIQVGQLTLWNLCLKYDPSKETSFNGYVVQSIKWRINDELLTKGKPIKVSTKVSFEEREKLSFLSTDLHVDGGTVTDFFAVSPVNVEDSVLRLIELQETLKLLNQEEKIVLTKKLFGFTDSEISKLIGRNASKVIEIMNAVISKINMDNYSVEEYQFQ